MAENNIFGIEDTFSEAHKVNDILFTETKPEDLEDVKKKDDDNIKKDDIKKDKPVAGKNISDKKQASAKKEEEEEDDDEKKKDDVIKDPTSTLFGEKKDEEDDEEVGKEEKDKVDDENNEEEDDDDKDQTQFEILSKELYKIGVFTPDVDEDSGDEIVHTAKTAEEFKKLFDYQKQSGMYAMLENHLSRFGEDRLDLFEAIFNKGVDPKEYLPIYNEIDNLESLTLDTEVNQERIVREAYKRNGLAEDKINSRVQRLKDMSELQAEAEDLKTLLIDQDKKALKKQEDDKVAALKAEEARDAQYKASISKILIEKSKTKDFDGIPISEQSARQTFDYLYNKKWQDANGKKFTDFDKFYLELNKPENHTLKIKTALLWQNNLDLSKVQKKAVSKESSELFQGLTTKKTKQANKAKTAPAPWNL